MRVLLLLAAVLLASYRVLWCCRGCCIRGEDLTSGPFKPLHALLEVLNEDSTDQQANAVRRQGVDSTLLRYAGMVLADAPPAFIYDVKLPPSLNGIQAQAILLASSYFSQFRFTFKEFTIPQSASFIPTDTYMALVYRQISSFTVYTLPAGYQFGGPVLGIISSPSNSTSIDPSLQASINLPADNRITIDLPVFTSNPANVNLFCAFFSSNGSIFVGNLASLPNVCTSSTLGDFALVFQSSGASSAPSPPLQAPPPPPAATRTRPATNNNPTAASPPTKPSSKHWKLIVAVTCLSLAGLGLIVAIVIITIKLAQNIEVFLTSRYTGNEEALGSSLIGGSRAPSAGVVRTKPGLEIDMAHFTS